VTFLHLLPFAINWWVLDHVELAYDASEEESPLEVRVNAETDKEQ
jgi:hypothetical protein